MVNIEDYISLEPQVTKKLPIDLISKMIIADSEVKNDTVPNAMVVGGLQELGFKRISPIDILKILLCHPALERGIEFKFNRMIKQLDKNNIGNNIIPFNNSKISLDAKNYITEIMYNSSLQPVTWIKQFGRDAMRFGDNYAVLKLNKAGNKVVRWELQNPIFFSPMFDISGSEVWKSATGTTPTSNLVKFRINSVTKLPKSYTQLEKITPVGMTMGAPYSYQSTSFDNTSASSRFFDYNSGNQNVNLQLKPVSGKPFIADRIMHLNFDRMGDDPLGIPLAQTLIQTIKQVIRVEDAGAETMVAFGYNKWISHTPFRTKEKMQEYAKSIENIRNRSVVILPEGVKLDNIVPGSTEFDKTHRILLTLIAMRLGMSITQLTGEGTETNKSTIGSLIKDIRYDFFADELEIEKCVNDGIIKSCKIKYKLRTPQQIKNFPYPVFQFSEMKEDALERAERLIKDSLSLRNVVFSFDVLLERGYKKEAEYILNHYLDEIIPDKKTQLEFKGDSAGGNSENVTSK